MKHRALTLATLPFLAAGLAVWGGAYAALWWVLRDQPDDRFDVYPDTEGEAPPVLAA